MTTLFDTNILIDAAVSTRRYHGAAVRLVAAAERGEIDGLFAPTSVAPVGTWPTSESRRICVLSLTS